MQACAADTDDALLHLLAEQVQSVVDTHWNTSAGGCSRCYGEVSLCDSWDNAQAVILTWLMQRAGLV